MSRKLRFIGRWRSHHFVLSEHVATFYSHLLEKMASCLQIWLSVIRAHPNNLLPILIEPPESMRLQRNLPQDIPTRFIIP
jgi:hypothetical protein